MGREGQSAGPPRAEGEGERAEERDQSSVSLSSLHLIPVKDLRVAAGEPQVVIAV